MSLSSIVASQNVNQFFEIKPLTAKAKKYNFELKLKDENTSFSTQSLQNFTLSWKVNVLDKTTSQILQTLEINDQVYSQKIKINQVFAPTEIFSNTKNTNFNQYYNPSIWYVGNNTYFARADANDGSNYNIAENNVKQVESWSYDGGKSWSNPQVFLELATSKTQYKSSVANGVTVFDSQKNKLFFVANFWAGNYGPTNRIGINKTDLLYGLNADGLWRAWRAIAWKNNNFYFSENVLLLNDDSEFDANQTLYYQLYQWNPPLPTTSFKPSSLLSASQIKEFYDQDQKNIPNSQYKIYLNKYEDPGLVPDPNSDNWSGFVKLQYDPNSGILSSKFAFAPTLAEAKVKFNPENVGHFFDGHYYLIANRISGTQTGMVFTFEKDLTKPVSQRQWKLISKYPENFEFALKKPDGTLINETHDNNQYINLNPGNGVVLKNGIYGVVFNHGGFGIEANNPSLVTGKYDPEKKKIFWQNQGKIKDDNTKKLMFTQVADGSNFKEIKFAFLTSFFGKNNDLLFHRSGKVNSGGKVAEQPLTPIDVDQENKNSLGFTIDHRSFYSALAGFQSAQGDAWFLVAGPSKNQTGTSSYNQDGLILLVNSDFSRIYPIGKISGSFQNSAINIESAEKTENDWTKLKFVISYELKNDGKTSVNFQKYDLDLDLKEKV